VKNRWFDNGVGTHGNKEELAARSNKGKEKWDRTFLIGLWSVMRRKRMKMRMREGDLLGRMFIEEILLTMMRWWGGQEGWKYWTARQTRGKILRMMRKQRESMACMVGGTSRSTVWSKSCKDDEIADGEKLTQEHEEQENCADDSKESVISEKDACKKWLRDNEESQESRHDQPSRRIRRLRLKQVPAPWVIIIC
jgi:hypothetical protein